MEHLVHFFLANDLADDRFDRGFDFLALLAAIECFGVMETSHPSFSLKCFFTRSDRTLQISFLVFSCLLHAALHASTGSTGPSAYFSNVIS